jgi:hypothetical protein
MTGSQSNDSGVQAGISPGSVTVYDRVCLPCCKKEDECLKDHVFVAAFSMRSLAS